MERDPYLYEDVPVLKNILGIKEQELLEKYENDITLVNLISAEQFIEKNNIDLDYLKNLHKHIFGDIYDWAGEFRKIQIVKEEPVLGGDTIRYSSPGEIQKNAENAIEELSKFDWTSLGVNEKAKQFSRIIARLWQVHPFREGNTRTTILFASHFAEKNGFPLDRQLLLDHIGYTRNALVKASDGMYAEYNHLESIIKDSMERGLQKVYCTNEIKKSGFIPTGRLINGMMKLNKRLKKDHTVQEIHDMYKNIQSYSEQDKDIITALSQEFKKQELKEINKNAAGEFELS